MSATEGVYSSKPNPVDPAFNDLRYVLPQSYVPTKDTRVTLRGKHGDIQVPLISWGAWSWGRQGDVALVRRRVPGAAAGVEDMRG